MSIHDAVTPRTPPMLRLAFWLAIAVGVAIVVRRFIALRQSAASGAPQEMARLDAWFQNHAALTYAHILMAIVFLVLLPLIFWRVTRSSAVVRVGYYGIGALVGFTAYAMSAYSVGGWVERSAVLLFNSWFLITLCVSLYKWRAGMPASERRWTLRSASTCLGISTTRPVMGVFFATSRITHWAPSQFFGLAFWIGFSINVTVIELWLFLYSRKTV